MSDDCTLSTKAFSKSRDAASSDVRIWLRGARYMLLYDSCEVIKHSYNVASTLGRDFKEATAKLCRQGSTLNMLNLPVRFQIALCASHGYREHSINAFIRRGLIHYVCMC